MSPCNGGKKKYSPLKRAWCWPQIRHTGRWENILQKRGRTVLIPPPLFLRGSLSPPHAISSWGGVTGTLHAVLNLPSLPVKIPLTLLNLLNPLILPSLPLLFVPESHPFPPNSACFWHDRSHSQVIVLKPEMSQIWGIFFSFIYKYILCVRL